MLSTRPTLASKHGKDNLEGLFCLIVMKADTHPKSYPAVYVDVSSNAKFFTVSSQRSKTTEEIDGVSYQVFVCDITSDSHPVFTGEKRLVDTAGRVEKFRSKFGRRRA